MQANGYSVVANGGWESEEMIYVRASIFAERLRRLGNYAVWVRISR